MISVLDALLEVCAKPLVCVQALLLGLDFQGPSVQFEGGTDEVWWISKFFMVFCMVRAKPVDYTSTFFLNKNLVS